MPRDGFLKEIIWEITVNPGTVVIALLATACVFLVTGSVLFAALSFIGAVIGVIVATVSLTLFLAALICAAIPDTSDVPRQTRLSEFQ